MQKHLSTRPQGLFYLSPPHPPPTPYTHTHTMPRAILLLSLSGLHVMFAWLLFWQPAPQLHPCHMERGKGRIGGERERPKEIVGGKSREIFATLGLEVSSAGGQLHPDKYTSYSKLRMG